MAHVEYVKDVDGRWLILTSGFQYGGKYDASGAGDATFPTRKEAKAFFVREEERLRQLFR